MGNITSIALDAQGVSERTSSLVQPQSANRWNRRKFAGIKPDTLTAAIAKAEKGDVEDWADLAQWMSRDHHVRAKIEDRILAIVSSELVVEPALSVPEELQAIAEEGAEFVRRSWHKTEEFESILASLIHGGEDIGWAGAFHRWTRTLGEWHSTPSIIEPRDIRFQYDWVPQVRTYDQDEQRSHGRWFDSRDYDRQVWIWHVPQKLDRPTVAGDLMAVAWPWLFRRWCELFRQEGLEKFASPFITGKVPPNAPASVRDSLQDALENMSADQIAILEEGTSIEFNEAVRGAGDAWSDAIERLNRAITVGLLGSNLNTDNTNTGSRALGESQDQVTILPRLQAMAKRIAATLERDWAATLLKMNAHRFGGFVPPTPAVRFELEREVPPTIQPDQVMTGLRVKQNEYRASVGLDALSPEEGGDHFVMVPQSTISPAVQSSPQAPMVSGVAATARPFGQQTLPMTRHRRTATICASQTRAGKLPFE